MEPLRTKALISTRSFLASRSFYYCSTKDEIAKAAF
jgi:hypothetical protein